MTNLDDEHHNMLNDNADPAFETMVEDVYEIKHSIPPFSFNKGNVIIKRADMIVWACVVVSVIGIIILLLL
jgi:hypothetical protein